MDNYLENLSDEELLAIAKNTDLNLLLQPIKQKNKYYAQYISSLGRLEKKSILVQKNLPPLAVKLYRKQDPYFVAILERQARDFQKVFIELMAQTLEHEMRIEEIQAFTPREYADILTKFEVKQGNVLDMDLFWAQLKLNGIFVDGDKREQIFAMLIKQRGEAKVDATKQAGELDSLPPKEEESQEEKKVIREEPIEVKEKKEQYTQEEKKVSTYAGRVSIKSNYYNFAPICELAGKSFAPLSEIEIDRLLPKSQYRNINLYYNIRDEGQVKFMQNRFHDGQLILFEFETDELQLNKDSSGNINPTGYKIPGVDAVKAGKIRFLSDDGFYFLKNTDILLDDIYTHKIVRLSYEDIVEGEKILINLRDGFYAGPYEVKYSPTSLNYFIRPDVQENKYTLKGYAEKDLVREEISPALDEWTSEQQRWYVYYIKDNATSVVKDVITDEALLTSFRDSINKSNESDIRISGIEAIIQNYKESAFSGDIVTNDIVSNRTQRIKELLTSETDLEELFANLSDTVCELILKNKNDALVDELIDGILLKRPDFAEKIQSMRSIKARVEYAKQELEQLTVQKADIQAEIQHIQEEMQHVRDNTEEDAINNNADKAINSQIREKEEELSKILEKLELTDDIGELAREVERLKEDVRYFESHKSHLENDSKNLESTFVNLVNRYSDKLVDITFDGYMSSKMLQAAAKWEQKEETRGLEDSVIKINSVELEDMDDITLVDYLVQTIQIERPGYDRNTIVNFITCLFQGFLTVFSGAPGCGKTSICNIIAKTLGLNGIAGKVEEDVVISDVNRYIPVSVERGWTSKRDFIGYFNPLTKAFEESNREVFDGLRLLNIEAQKGINNFPYVILLDEANLSPMEYYWADFMNVCDDLEKNNHINLGNNNVFTVPETLHFVATINNDHTTETLSPRLIDRAWVITLPKNRTMIYGDEIPDDKVKIVSWKKLKDVFVAPRDKNLLFDSETQKIYEGIKGLLKHAELSVSPRVDIAIRKYWYVASQLMEEDEYANGANIIALDYAVSQKILPKIIGSGDDYAEWLGEFRSFCVESNLLRSADILSSIIERGNKQMKYFQFFN